MNYAPRDPKTPFGSQKPVQTPHQVINQYMPQAKARYVPAPTEIAMAVSIIALVTALLVTFAYVMTSGDLPPKEYWGL